LEEVGKRNVIRGNSLSNSGYWQGPRQRPKKNIDVHELHNIKDMNSQNYVMKHEMWKINNKRKKIQALSNFEMRLEMTLQKKKLKKKELEKKYYGYNFKPKTNRKRINIYNKPKTGRIKNKFVENKKKKVNSKNRKIQNSYKPKKKIGKKRNVLEVEHTIESQSFNSENSNEIGEIKNYLKQKPEGPRFKRFISKTKGSTKERKKIEILKQEEEFDKEDMISMDGEDDISDQLNDSNYGGY
jgi:hypothetical protein